MQPTSIRIRDDIHDLREQATTVSATIANLWAMNTGGGS